MSDGESLEATTCPVLWLTPDVEEAFTWFYATHELSGGELGVPQWRRNALPSAGGIAEQDAQLMDTLDHLRSLFNSKLAASKP